jgi:YfiH family protein
MERVHRDGVPIVRFPRLSAEAGVFHAVFTRAGGVSARPYATLNLGHTVGDELAAVEENHKRALGALGLDGEHVVTCHQVHGARVGVVDRDDLGTVQPATDALVTAQPHVPLLLRFADCVPVLFFDPVCRAVGLAHAGWRGLAARVLPATVAALVDLLGCDPRSLWAGIGPAIGRCCYEVDEATSAQVAAACPPGAEIVERRGQCVHLDLHAAARAQLSAAGVGSIEDSGLCTACRVGEFFSHRAERGRTGRFGIVIGLVE